MKYLHQPCFDGVFGRLHASFKYRKLPEFYEAASISDFQRNKDIVKVTRKILTPARYLNGFAVVIFAHLRHHDFSLDVCQLRDLSGSIEARLDFQPSLSIKQWNDDRDELTDGIDIYEVHIACKPNNPELYLINWRLALMEDTQTSPNISLDYLVQPA